MGWGCVLCVFEQGALEFFRKEKEADMAVSYFESSLVYRLGQFSSQQAFSLQVNSAQFNRYGVR